MKEKCNENVRILRRRYDYSQEYIAYQLGISQKTYSLLEQGKIKVSFEIISNLANILKVTSSTLIEISNDCNCIFKDKHLALMKYLTDLKIKVPSEFLIIVIPILV